MWLEEELELNKNQNLVISPLSLYQALALFGHGLNDRTLAPFLKYYGRTLVDAHSSENKGSLLPVDQADFRIQLGEDMLSDDQVKIANSIWGNRFLPEYLADTKTYLKADAKPLPENTSVINKWIEEKTAGKIANLLFERETTPLDLFLVNAIYFKAEWLSEFEPFNTQKESFKSPTGVVNVDMMFDKKKVDYYEDEQLQAIRLPYKVKKHSMTFILPKEHVVWADFIERLKMQDFYLNFLEKMSVKIYLPKFKLEYRPENMKQILKNMGLEAIFKNTFLGTKNGATLADIVHKSIISVDEKGTEAAAATVMMMKEGLLFDRELKRKEPYFIFKADRPFLFMVDEGLFVGVVTDPTKE